jgi:hypothetical protein
MDDLYNQSTEFKNVLGAFFPGKSYDDLDHNQRIFAIMLLGGQQPDGGFTDASASASYYNQMSANGLNRGGVSGYAEVAVGQVGEDLLDFFGGTGVQNSAMQSGYASADPNRRGAALGWGALTVGSIAMSAIPGGGKAANVAEQEGVKVLTSNAARGATPLLSTISGESMDSALFQRIQSAFQRNGGVMQANAETTAYLEQRGAEGISYGADTILLPENPSTSAVYEELIHTAQVRAGMTDELEMEIQAAQKLINFADLYKIPATETQQTIERLNALLQQRGQ